MEIHIIKGKRHEESLKKVSQFLWEKAVKGVNDDKQINTKTIQENKREVG
ncbi:hypothetical protein HXA31_20335 [Salipaludibacillus agaradhaerens]|uniref:Uncharacterized protein n=1 Tax=Salipaludibacillus agaradhaerens TaxID=76935 RepID=A0A9Q4B2S2_SALAG|nr:hypothetical protein [Salipaludibacillus agaradhaerens]MCR6096910.1 hypothetical protein [Salipaludibacillus agaradhaerens]MCR6116680.1 hypothetical protein [Salipaludibacillus agaradhaerens]